MNKIIKIRFGSHLYGTNTPESDADYKSIYLPSARQIVLHNYSKVISTSRPKQVLERNTKDDVDEETYSLDRFIELLMQGQTVALDMLFAGFENFTYHNCDGILVMNEIMRNRDKILTKNINAFTGYAKQQAAKYGIKGSRLDALKRTVELLDTFIPNSKLGEHAMQIESLVKESQSLISVEKTPLIELVDIFNKTSNTMIRHLHVNGRKVPYSATVKVAKSIYSRILNEYGARAHKAHLSGGKDWKALSHAVRVNHEAVELLKTGKITFPRPERELLLAIKQEQMPYEKVAELIEQGLAEVYEASKQSTLRDVPDRQWTEDFIHEIYHKIVRDSLD